jgi:hypothetical protein
MPLEAKAAVLWVFAVGLALAFQIWRRWRGASANASTCRRFPEIVSLASVAAALISVGVVSGTVRTHFIQITPLVLLLALRPRAEAWGSAATSALLAWWLVTMAGIWLFLLGLSRFLTGTFSATEILLTIVIGVACLFGLFGIRRGEAIPLTREVLTIVLAAGLQSVVLWLSYQPVVIRR